MRAFIIRRIGQSILVCLGVAVVTFLLLRLAHDPVYVLLPPESTKEEIETLRKAMGFDRPLPVQFAFFVGRLLQGDFGNSFVMAQPASALIWERMPATLELSFAGMAIALAVAIPLGVLAAFRRNTLIDTFCTSFAVSDKVLYWGISPLAKGYRYVFPSPVRKSIDKFGYNLAFPVRLQSPAPVPLPRYACAARRRNT